MKDYTSKFLKSVAWGYLLFPLTYLAFVAIVFDVPLSGLGDVLLSPLFYVNSAVGVLTGYGLREVKRWGWYLLVVSAALVFYENALILHTLAETHHRWGAYVVSLLIPVVLVHRVSREVRVPYFFPRIRWWESNPRYKLSVPVRLKRLSKRGESQSSDAPAVEGEILDLSMGGCFVKISGMEIGQDERVSVLFKVFGLNVECKGTVVWQTGSTVTHPRGVGVKFAIETREQRRALRQINSRLRKIASLYRRSRYLMSQDEFLKRLDELENYGRFT